MRILMNRHIVPSNKLALLSAAFCAVMFAFSHNTPATTLTFNDVHVVGTVTPGTPANPANIASYINFMITLASPGSGTFRSEEHTSELQSLRHLVFRLLL